MILRFAQPRRGFDGNLIEAEHAVDDDAADAADLVIFSTADEIERVVGATVGVG